MKTLNWLAPLALAVVLSGCDERRAAGVASHSASVSSDPCPQPAAGPAATRLISLGATEGEVTDALRVAALLTDENGSPLSNRAVSFALGAAQISAMTDDNGVARAQLTPETTYARALAIAYAGEASYQPSSASAAVAIDRDETEVRYTGPRLVALGQPQDVSAVLLDPEDDAPLAGKTLTFASGSATATAVTGADGAAHATLLLPVSGAVGAGTLSVSFAGDELEKPSSDTAPITAYLATSFVLWGGNAGGVQPGQRVGFWGAQWAKQVQQGDYDAHADFKGWAVPAGAIAVCEPGAHSTGAPLLDQSCWSSKPGNSGPPATLPEYIGAIVATSIAKDRGVIYGNVAGLALVKVDASPAYGNDPGHPGSGVVQAAITSGPSAPSLVATQTQPPAVLPGAPFDVRLSVTNGGGAATSAQASETIEGASPGGAIAALGAITSGATVSATFHETAEAVSAREPGEDAAAYLSRLGAVDGSPLDASATVRTSDAAGLPGLTARARSSGRRAAPVLALSLAAPTVALPGRTVTFTVRAADVGNADAAGAVATLTLPDGSTRTLDLGAIASGASASASVDFTVPAPPPRAAGESVSEYVARLQALDGAPLAASVSLRWTDALGAGYGPVEQGASSTEHLPILTAAPAQPAPALPGQAVPLPFAVRNVGSCPAQATLGVTNPDGSAGTGASFTLAAQQSAAAQTSGRAPAVPAKGAGESDTAYLARLQALENAPVPFGWSLGWSDGAGTSFGDETGAVTSSERLPIVAIALSGPASAVSGDSITFTATLSNVGLATASVALTAHMPDGTTRSSTVPSIAPGGSVTVPLPYAVPADQPTGPLSASASETWTDAAGGAYGPLSAGASVPVRHPPVVSAGPAQTVTLPAAASLSGSVSEPGLPADFAFTTLWSLASGPAPVTFDDPSRLATAAHFTAAGTYVLRLTASDGSLSASATSTVTVLAPLPAGALTLSPAQAGPNPVGSSQQLRATLLDSGGHAIPGQSIAFQVTGANPTSGTGTTDASGAASFSYSGAAAGTDTAIATASSGERSNASAITWLVPVQVISTSTIDGMFFTADGSGIFNTPPTQTPVFRQTFPTINFNPPAGTVPGNTSGVGVNTRPMVDVTTDLNGNFTGTIVAQGNGAQAGVGSLFAFNAVFFGSFVVAAAGDRTFSFYSDDGFLFGVGNGATALPGNPRVNVPASGRTPFQNLPVMGAYNTPTAPVGNNVAVHFPGPGVYPYEIDYSECCGGQIALTLTSSSTSGHGLPPAGSLTLAPGSVASAPVGVPRSFTVTARDAAGAAQVGVVVTMTVTGVNQRILTQVTGATGVATFSYAGMNIGNDSLQATAVLGGMGGISNVGTVQWVANPNHPPVVNAGPDQSGTISGSSVTLALHGSVTDDGLPSGGALTQQWSMVSGPAPVTFSAPAQLSTDATFTAGGSYVLQLTASDSQLTSSAQVRVTIARANQAPVVSAGADQEIPLLGSSATAQLQGTVTDDGLPAGAAVTQQWSLVSGPAPVTFSAPAQLSTNATFTATGSYVLQLAANDTALTGSSRVTVTVVPGGSANQPPVVSAGAGQTVTISGSSVMASLRGSVSDDGLPTGGTLTQQWSLVSGPAPVTFSAPTSVATSVTLTAPGVYALRLTASDSQLGTSSRVTVTVNPGPANQPPVVNAGAPQTITLPATTATLRGTVTDDGLPSGGSVAVRWSLASGPAPVVFGTPRAAVTAATFSTPGTYALRLTATDSQLTASADTTVIVLPPAASTGGAPVVAFNGALDGTLVTAPVAVVGSVNDGFWKLEYALNPGNPSAAWTTFASGTGPLANAALGTFDPSRLLNGGYGIRLSSFSSAGASQATVGVSVRGALKVGVFTLSYLDVAVPVAGLPIQVFRKYDSRDKRTGDFGVGWTVSIADVRVDETVTLGNPWQETATGGFFPVYCIQPTRAPMVTVTLSDEKSYTFMAQPVQPCQFLLPYEFVQMGFQSVGPAPGATLVALDAEDSPFVIGGPTGAVQLVEDDTLEPWNPQRFQLTTETGQVMVVNSRTGLESLTDRNGNTLFVGRDGIISSTGKSVTFARDAQGRITSITDPNGHARQYQYDLYGDLVTALDRDGHASTYGYDDRHDLASILDPGGVTPSRDEYDAEGRLSTHTDPNGHVIRYAHDLAARHELVTDREGNATLYEYDGRGNIIRVTDALGGVSTRTYDANDNKLSETDAYGNTRRLTYDAGNHKLSETDPLGNVTRYTYNAQGQVLTMTDPRGLVTTNTYDARGNLLTTTDPTGAVTRHAYDAQGLEISVTDPLGNATQTAYDASGNPSQVTDPLGQVATFTYDAGGNRQSETVTRTGPSGTEMLTTRYSYDAQGRLLATVRPDGTVVRTEYDDNGKRAATVDPLGRRTEYTYDEGGRQVTTAFPDGTRETYQYDGNGKRTAMVDRLGRTTRSFYNARGQLTRTQYPDGASTQVAYDANGAETSTTDALGNVTTYQNDAASRRVRETDPLGHATAIAYDEANNVVSRTDALGRTTRLTYDGDGRQTRVDYADGTSETQAFDAAGRLVSRTDAAGVTTSYGYNAAGQLTSVTDPVGVVHYGYDEVGNRVSLTDANGNVTQQSFDALGRRTSRTFPGGARERWTYDAAGDVASHTGANGRTTTFEYDANDRLLTKAPDPALGEPVVRLTWSATGTRLSMTDASGVTQYGYDARDRLLTKATPQGTITHTFDAAGNLRSVRTSNAGGAAVDYAYDAAGRLQSVTDARLSVGTTDYDWDDGGNLRAYIAPNGVQTNLTYDARNRLTSIGSSLGAAALTHYAYTLGPAGNRTRVEELGGRAVDYAYDALYRLTSETISGDAISGAIRYAYDAAGNRLSRTSSVPGVSSTSASYDRDDRPSIDATDPNGNTTSSGGKSWAYDFEDRLASQDGGAVTVVYDGDGNRVAKTVGGVTTRYLVDELNPTGYAQVLEDLSGGAVHKANTWGHALLHQRRLAGAAGVSFYLYDGQGSVRALADAGGAVTDRYDYDAYGVLLRSAGGTPNDYRYAGELSDPDLGLTFLRSRYLNPSSGRFLTRDRFDPVESEPRSLHRYIYAFDDPANRSDPSGMMSPQMAGMLVHQLVGLHFVAENPLCRLSNRSISTIVGTAGTSLLRPDLTDICFLEAYEIKPATSYAAGVVQLDGYIVLLISLTKLPWHPGFIYLPPPAVPLSTTAFARVNPPRLGVITYTLIDFDEFMRLIQAQQEAEMAELEDETALAVEEAELGGI